MKNKQRVLQKLRGRLDLPDHITDDEILQAAKGTLLIARAEFSVAMDDLKSEVVKSFLSSDEIQKVLKRYIPNDKK